MSDSRKKFIYLLGEMRSLLGYSLREEDLSPEEDLAMEMNYGGFQFSVVHSVKNSPKKMLIECVFGQIPLESEEKILINLLEMNCALAEIDGSVFCLDQDSDELTYTIALDMNLQSAETVLRKMTEIVWHGRRWLKNNFLINQDELKNPALEIGILA
jgi:hypothetical protein